MSIPSALSPHEHVVKHQKGRHKFDSWHVLNDNISHRAFFESKHGNPLDLNLKV